MRLLLATLLLFTNGFVRDYGTHAAQYEAYGHPQQRQWIVAAFAINEEKVSEKESDPYDPRQDCLYRLYLAATVLGVLGGIVGVAVIFWQIVLLKKTVDASSEQSKAMERHIGEAARSADAMEKVVTTIDAGNKAVMRAYLTAVIGSPIFQERRLGQSDLKFEGRPHLVNTGNTQARKVRILIKAAILPSPLPSGFVFPPLEELRDIGDATVAAHQTYIMAGIVEDFVPDAEVASIKEGAGKCLYVWGVVTYEDIFGDRHTTKFGQQITWLPNGQAFGYYISGQNDAD
jgi:hypothetical protein